MGGTIFIIKALRVALYSVLAVFEPLVVWVFGCLTLVLLGMVFFFSVLLGLPHFPAKTVLAMGVGSALAIPAYYAVMYLLPSRLGTTDISAVGPSTPPRSSEASSARCLFAWLVAARAAHRVHSGDRRRIVLAAGRADRPPSSPGRYRTYATSECGGDPIPSRAESRVPSSCGNPG